RSGPGRPRRSATRARRSRATTSRRRSRGGGGGGRRWRGVAGPGARGASPRPRAASPPPPARASPPPPPRWRPPRRWGGGGARPADAAAEEARAMELWEAKGATVLAERARNGFGRVEPVERAPDDRARPARPVRRRVRANAATAIAARMDAALAARDAEAFAGVYADDVEYLDHTTGTAWGR